MAAPTYPAYGEIHNHDIHRLDLKSERGLPHKPSCAEAQPPLSRPLAPAVNAKVSDILPYDASSKRRVAMTLVDLCTSYIESVWPNQRCRLPLRTFVFEILRRSRVQYPVFQVALCYMARCRPYVVKYQQEHQGQYPPNFTCGRRILVAALQVASKFLQDRFYSAAVWSRVSGLDLKVLQENELALMQALDWKMFVSCEAYTESCRRLRISVDSVFAERCMGTPGSAQVLTPESSPTGSNPVDNHVKSLYENTLSDLAQPRQISSHQHLDLTGCENTHGLTAFQAGTQPFQVCVRPSSSSFITSSYGSEGSATKRRRI